MQVFWLDSRRGRRLAELAGRGASGGCSGQAPAAGLIRVIGSAREQPSESSRRSGKWPSTPASPAVARPHGCRPGSARTRRTHAACRLTQRMRARDTREGIRQGLGRELDLPRRSRPARRARCGARVCAARCHRGDGGRGPRGSQSRKLLVPRPRQSSLSRQ
jgi:hypothetical protein